MHYKTPEIFLWGITVEHGFATSVFSDSSEPGRIYFETGTPDNDIATN